MENNKVRISDFGIRCVDVYAPDHETAAEAGAAYVAKTYPGKVFNTERGLTGMFGGALVTGVVHTLRVPFEG